jgi:YesN/AraC family two-component response regulator
LKVEKRKSNLIEKAFPFEVLHIDEPANNMNTFHWHEFMEISFIQSGKGKYEIEDKEFFVCKGDIIVINNIERHRLTYNTQEPLYETVIHFDPSLISSRENTTLDFTYMKLFKYERASFNNKPDLTDEIKEIVKSLISDIITEYMKKLPYFELMLKSKLLTLITHLLRQCNAQPVSDFEIISKRNQIERLEKILDYINDNYSKDISLDSIANKFFMNSSYFSDYFKRNIGINYSEYLSKKRINQAIQLLNESRMSSTEAAFNCGFNNVTSFYNAFKKVTGMSPGDYLKSSKWGDTV